MVERRDIKGIAKHVLNRLVLSTSLMLALTFSAIATEQNTKCLKLGADEGLAAFHPLFENLVAAIYKRAGYCASSISLTPNRIEMMLSAGTLDADWMRVEDYTDHFHIDLVEVPIPLFQIDVVLLSSADSDFNGTPADLKGRTVGYHSGFRWMEKSLPVQGAIPREIPAGVPVQELLLRGRFEVFATDGVRAHQILEAQGNGQTVIRQTTWRKLSFFHLVHKRHKDKIDALETEIQKAMNAGEFDQIFALPGLSRVVDGSN